MNRLIFILTLILLFVETQTVSAQNTDSAALLPNLVIRDNRLQIRFSETSRSIDIISRRQIEAAPVQNIAELLNYVAGVDVRQRGVMGIQPDVTIRGGTFDQVLVLINGTKLTDPQTGHHSLNLPLDLENIERIEILKGAAARIYGQNAFTGAINIVTRKNTEGVILATAQAGDWNLIGGKLGLSAVGKRFSQNLSFAHNQSDGYRPNSDFKLSNVFYQNQAILGRQPVNLIAGYTERKFGASGFYNIVPTSNERENIQTNFVAIDAPLSINEHLSLTPRFSWRRNQDEYFFDYSTETTRANTRNFTLTQVLSAELNGSYISSLGTTGLSLEWNDAQYFNKRLGNHRRTLYSAFLEHRFHLLNEKLDITPGVMLAHYSDFGTQVFPGIDLGFRLTESTKIFASYGKTYRVPTFTDLYFFNAANLANPNLLPETAHSVELGAKFVQNKINVQVAVFQRDAQNMIDRTRDSTNRWNGTVMPWFPTNFNSLLLRGVEASVSLQVNILNGSRVDVSYFNIFDNEFTRVQKFSRYALDFLTSQFSFSFESGVVGKLRQNIRVRQNKRYNQTAHYNVTDARLFWQGKLLTPFIQANNIFDTDYTEQNNIPMPRRWFSGGVNFKFVYKK
jgi:iron complex outermembrane receptor protein